MPYLIGLAPWVTQIFIITNINYALKLLKKHVLLRISNKIS